MIDSSDVKLENIDPEEISDVIVKLGKSFGIKFGHTDFQEVKTFGELCDVVELKVTGLQKNDCTSQQAFYRIREALSVASGLDKKEITLQTELAFVFPYNNRRYKMKLFQKQLGLSVDVLGMKGWLASTIAGGFLLSFLFFFFSWKLAIMGLLFFFVFAWVAGQFSKELNLGTVKQLTEMVAREHYMVVRRQPGTVNRNEIVQKIREVFMADLYLNKEMLTRDASFV